MKVSQEKESELIARQNNINIDTMKRLENSQEELNQQNTQVRKLEKKVEEYEKKIKQMGDSHKKELEDAKRPEKKRK